jgi:hypothetical protein
VVVGSIAPKQQKTKYSARILAQRSPIAFNGKFRYIRAVIQQEALHLFF